MSSLLSVAVVDLQIYKIPNPILTVTAILGLTLMTGITLIEGDWSRVFRAILIGGLAGGVFLLIALISGGMGMGDVKLVGVIGFYLGFLSISYLLVAVLAAFLSGALVGIGLMIFGKHGRRDRVPFGVFLALGTFFSIFFAPEIANWYLNLA